MSRTKHGSKGSGYEYWSKRPGPTSPGKFAKTVTHKIERQQNKKLGKHEQDATDGVDSSRGGEHG